MPELKRNFLKGKMNKDLDERLVPNGEYRDALNIEISTSESSNVGSAQTLRGNSKITTSLNLSSNAIAVGHYVDNENSLIYSFIHKASDFDSNGLGVRSDAIIVTDPKTSISRFVFVDVYDVRYIPDAISDITITGISGQSVTADSGILFSGPIGIRVGMRVQAIDTNGNDLWGIQNDVKVKRINVNASSIKITEVNGIATPYTAQNISDEVYIKFTSERVLNFQAGTTEEESNVTGSSGAKYTPNNNIITGINIVDDFLLFTDGRNEPKKINITRFLNSAANLTTHSKLRLINNESIVDTYEYADESHITVIRKNPTLPLLIENKYSESYGATFTQVTGNTSGFASFFEANFALHDGATLLDTGDYFYIKTIANTNYPTNILLKLVGSSSGTIVYAYVSSVNLDGDNEYKLRLTSTPEGYTTSEGAESWTVSVVNNSELYKTSFVNFTYRYKYTDGELSCLAPYSLPAFLPSVYSYSPKDGFNLGMENQVSEIKIKGFNNFNIPKDVVGIDIIIKSSSSENHYIIRSINKEDEEFSEGIYNDGVFNSNYRRGSITLTSKAIGRTLESSQITRIFDNVPRTALAQEFSAGRLLYGNYLEDYNLSAAGKKINPKIGINAVKNSSAFSATYAGDYLFEANANASDNNSVVYNDVVPCTTEFDPSNSYDNSNYVFDVPEDGTYGFEASIDIMGYFDPTGAGNSNNWVPSDFYLALCESNSTGSVIGDELITGNINGNTNEYVSLYLNGEVALTSTQYVCLVLKLNNTVDQYDAKNARFQCVSSPSTTYTLTTLKGVPSIKSLRTYKVGIVYADKYGRQSTVVVEEKSSLSLSKTWAQYQSKLQVTARHLAPYWAETYKFFIKEVSKQYYNLILDAAFDNNDNETAWLVFNSADKDKVKIGDYLIQKKLHNSISPVTSEDAKWKVLDIQGTATNFSNPSGDNAGDSSFSIGDNNITISNAIISQASDLISKFFVKVNLDANFTTYIGNDFADLGLIGNNNGAAFETEPKETFDLDVFYEVSKAYPIKLTNKNAYEYIEIGSSVSFFSSDPDTEELEFLVDNLIDTYGGQYGKVIRVDGASSFPIGLDWTSSTPNSAVCTIKLDQNLPFNLISSYNIRLKFKSLDGSYVTAKVIDSALDTIRVIPYTHPTALHQDVTCSIALPFSNCYAFGNGVESDTIRDDYNAESIFPYVQTGKQSGFRFSLPDDGYKELKESTKIIYSNIYNEDTKVNKINQFLAGENIVKSINPENGSIQKLFSRDTDIIIFCEKKVLRGPINKNILYNVDGTSQLAATQKVIGDVYPYASGDHGISRNPESFAVDEFRAYFVDKARGSVLRLSNNGLTVISDYGMNDWFSDKLKTAQSIIGSFDTDKNEYNITVHEVTNPGWKKNVYTLSFNEDTNGWASFKSYIKEQGFSLDNRYYTYKAGHIWEHESDTVNRNNFYGTDNNSTITLLFNDQPGLVKEFTTINYEGTQSRIVEFTNESGYDDGEYYNVSAKTGWYVNNITTDLQDGSVPEFIEKENKWFNYIQGSSTTFDNSTGSGTLDTKEFSVQGLGLLQSDATIIEGSINDSGSNLIFNNATGLSTVGWTTTGLSLYGVYALDGTQDNTFTIEPQPGYVVSASDFYNDTTSIYYSDVTFSDTGVAGTPNNTITVTITFINQTLGNENVLDLDLDIQSPDPTAQTYDVCYRFAVANVSSANQGYNLSSNLADWSVDEVYNDFFEQNYTLSGQANYGVQQVFNLTIYAENGYFFSQAPEVSTESNTASYTVSYSTNTENEIIEYNYVFSDLVYYDVDIANAAAIFVIGGQVTANSATFEYDQYYLDNSAVTDYFLPIINNGSIPQVSLDPADTWISISSVFLDGIYFDIDANAGADRDAIITMYDSYDIAQSDAQTTTINQATASLISIASIWNPGVYYNAIQTNTFILTSNGSAPVVGDFSIAYTDGSGWLSIDSINDLGDNQYGVVASFTENTSGADRSATVTVTHSDTVTTSNVDITQLRNYNSSLDTIDIYSDSDCSAFTTFGSDVIKEVVSSSSSFNIYAKSSSGLAPTAIIQYDNVLSNWNNTDENVPEVLVGTQQEGNPDLEIQLNQSDQQQALTCGGNGWVYTVDVSENYKRNLRIAQVHFFFEGSNYISNNTGTPDATLYVRQEGMHKAYFYSVNNVLVNTYSSLWPNASSGQEPLYCPVVSVDSAATTINVQFKTEINEATAPTIKWFSISPLSAGESYDWDTLWSGSALMYPDTTAPSYVNTVSETYNDSEGLGTYSLSFDAYNDAGGSTYRSIRLGIWHPSTTGDTRPNFEIEIRQDNAAL